MKKLILSGYSLFVAAANSLQSLILLIFRLTWGWQFFETGQGKLINHNDIADYFASLHIPAPGLNAWFIGGLECAGGVLLMLGLASRPIGFLLTMSMASAYLLDPDEKVKLLGIFNDPTPFLTADPFFFLLTAVLVFSFGPGWISLDALIGKLISDRKTSKEKEIL